MTSRTGNGRFQWNVGGWFGAQVGGTCWMIVGACSLCYHAYYVSSTVVLSLFLVTNFIGTTIYMRRAKVLPYPAIQFLMVLVGLSSMIGMVVVKNAGPMTWPYESGAFREPSYGWLVVFPAVMIFFHFLEWSGKRERLRASASEEPKPSTD